MDTFKRVASMQKCFKRHEQNCFCNVQSKYQFFSMMIILAFGCPFKLLRFLL